MPTITRQAVMTDLPVQAKEEFKEAIKAFQAEEQASVFIELNKNDQSLTAHHGGSSLDDVFAELDCDKPMYVVLRYVHRNNEDQECTKIIFIYSCPSEADRRLKFTYSTCKPNVLRALGFTPDCKLEVTSSDECTREKVHLALYPPAHVEQEINRPKPKKKRKGKSRRNVKGIL